jgi:hypothetical protein
VKFEGKSFIPVLKKRVALYKKSASSKPTRSQKIMEISNADTCAENLHVKGSVPLTTPFAPETRCRQYDNGVLVQVGNLDTLQFLGVLYKAGEDRGKDH